MLVAPVFHAERCVRYRYSYSECSRCADACPHQALALSDSGVVIKDDLCKACALCATACPTEALTENEVSAEHLLRIAGAAREMTVVCAPSGAGGDAVVPCLGALHPVVLAEMGKRGIALALTGTSHCGECAHGATGAGLLEQNLAAYALLCTVLGADGCAPLAMAGAGAASGRNEGHDRSRRGLFRRVVGHGMDVVTGKLEAAPAPLKAIRAAAPFLPERKLLLNKLFAFAVEDAVAVSRHAAIPAEDWQVDGGCTHCEACVRVCPTGALQLLENNSAWRLALLNDRCVACDVCAEVCQPGALRPADPDTVVVSKQKGRLLAAAAKRRCARCDRVFVNERGSDICPVCGGDDEDFASIFG